MIAGGLVRRTVTAGTTPGTTEGALDVIGTAFGGVSLCADHDVCSTDEHEYGQDE